MRHPATSWPHARRTSIDTRAWPPPPMTSTPASTAVTVVVAYTRAAAGGCAIDESTSLERPQRRAALNVALKRAFPLIQFAVDAAAWAVAVPLTTFLRYDMRIAPVNEAGVAATVAVAVVLQGLVGLALGLYRRRYHYGSFDEVRVLGFCVAIVVARHVRPRPALRRLARPPVGARAGGVPRARAGRRVPLRRPARRGPPPAPARRPVRAARRVRRRRRRRPDHAHAAAQPGQPVPAGRPGRRRSPPGPHAAQRAACARHRRRRPRRRHPPRRRLGARRHPLDHRRAAACVRRAAARRRPAGARAAAGRRAARARAAVGHPPDHGRRPPRPAPGRGRHGGDRRLRHRPAGARHRAPAARSAPSCAASCTPSTRARS